MSGGKICRASVDGEAFVVYVLQVCFLAFERFQSIFFLKQVRK